MVFMQSLTLESATEKSVVWPRLLPRLHVKAFTGGVIVLVFIIIGIIGPSIAPNLFNREQVAEKVKVGVIRLLSMRTPDGGVAMWSGSRETWPWASVYAAHFAVEARQAGHDVPDDLYDGLLAYAR